MTGGKLYNKLHPQGIYSNTNQTWKMSKKWKIVDKKWWEDNPKSTRTSLDHDKNTYKVS